LNGAMAASASLCRTFGPTFSGLLQAAGLSLGTLGLPWWVNASVAVLGAVLSLSMVEEKRRTFDSEKEAVAHHEEAEEAALIAVESPTATLETMQSTPGSPVMTRFDRRGSRL